MKNIGLLIPLTFFMPFLVACGIGSEATNQKYSMATTNGGKVIRLNTATGETCVVGENCDTNLSGLVVGESYIYKGNGTFQHQKMVNWEDLK